jgi:hypothetical protein
MADPPGKMLSANEAYWFTAETPDYTRVGPWTTRLLVFNERRTLAQGEPCVVPPEQFSK